MIERICLLCFFSSFRPMVSRQTPGDDLVWGNSHFSWGDEKGCSWLCVYDNVPQGWTTTIPKHRRILVVVEPKAIMHYTPDCLAQYGTVLSPYVRPASYEGRWVNAPILFPWLYGVYGFKEHNVTRKYATWDALKKPKTNKTKLLSVIQRNKGFSKTQLQRSRFIQSLLDIFGRKTVYLNSKADGIDAYRYHLALENDTGPHFWSEKLADCYLGEAYPIHAGCPNLSDYFPPQAYTAIDIFNIPQAIQRVKEVIVSDLWRDNRSYILEAKRRVMEEHQLLPVIDRVIRSADKTAYQPLTRPVPLKAGDVNEKPQYNSIPEPRNMKDLCRKYGRKDYYISRYYTLRHSIKKRLPF
ncbi:MAG: hypothetical protein GDA50_08805 [Alphaproteobacteria bacterium GM202ARS2]|nr:hypothetical protein [Alphaproteobacteria bacterium GM202ARS2]